MKKHSHEHDAKVSNCLRTHKRFWGFFAQNGVFLTYVNVGVVDKKKSRPPGASQRGGGSVCVALAGHEIRMLEFRSGSHESLASLVALILHEVLDEA